MSIGKVLSMAGGEFLQWRAYFEIYPFTFERVDQMHAELLAVTINDGRATRAGWAGKRSFDPVKIQELIPSYLPTEYHVTDPLQRAQYRAFKQTLIMVNARNNNAIRST